MIPILSKGEAVVFEAVKKAIEMPMFYGYAKTEDILKHIDLPDNLVRAFLTRLVRKGRLARVRHGFYCLIEDLESIVRDIRNG